ncbi:hypothetical protein [Streptococcus henryi]|jgi:hypothetical protein|uniref:hypothetical protein n=1 Tax=Streptococcus henryi TaxID=439219 RepID=UPI00036CE270|nr:hypothetical protein [Streptococcus henryi]
MKKIKSFIFLAVCIFSLQVNQGVLVNNSIIDNISNQSTIVSADSKGDKKNSSDNNIRQAKKIVKNLEKEPSEEKLLNAKKIVKKVKHKETKSSLKKRISKVEQTLIIDKADKAVKNLENNQIRENISDAQQITDRVKNDDKKADLNRRIQAVSNAITTRENDAEVAVKNLENDQNRNNISEAQTKTGYVSDSEKNADLNRRITAVISAIESREAQEQAAAQQAAQAAQDQSTATVYITATGKRYHLSPNCRGLNNSKSTSSTTLSDAEARGLTLCQFE